MEITMMTYSKHLFPAIATLFVASIFISSPAAAQSDMAADFLICDKLKDEDVRLACFSAIAAKMKGEDVSTDYAAPRRSNRSNRSDRSDSSALGDEQVNIPRTYVERPREVTRPGSFGDDQLQGDRRVKSSTPDRMVANIVRQWEIPFGNFAIELDNGQVWQSTEKPRFSMKRVQTVEIYKGMLSGYRLKAKGKPGMARVKRVQ